MRKVKWVASGLILCAVIIYLTAAAITYSSSPRFCSSCHIMETRYVSWRYSDHANYTDCLSCHSEPGALGELKAHLAGSRYVYSFLRGSVSRPILLADVPNENCFKCHEREGLEIKPGSINIHDTYHQIHIEKELYCVQCHGGLAHATMLPVKARSAMSICQKCHQRGTSALLACNQCHPSGPSSPAFIKRTSLKRGRQEH